jgi:hypothetical protein
MLRPAVLGLLKGLMGMKLRQTVSYFNYLDLLGSACTL